MIQASETLVNKIRVPFGGRDQAALRLRLGRTLSAMNLVPRDLSPEAIVCIRRLRDPRPGLLEVTPTSTRLAFEWEQAVSAKLAELVARAVRSLDEPVAPNAECVVFADKAHLLAALASDWCEGRITSCWWWQLLLKETEVSLVLRKAWGNAPQFIPAALQVLAQRKKIVRFAASLSRDEANHFLSLVSSTFALRALIEVLNDERKHQAGSGFAASSESVGVRPRAPWQPWAPEAESANLGFDQRRFVCIGLMLQRAPAQVRTESFALAVKQWQREIAASDSVPERKISGANKFGSGPQVPAAGLIHPGMGNDTTPIPVAAPQENKHAEDKEIQFRANADPLRTEFDSIRPSLSAMVLNSEPSDITASPEREAATTQTAAEFGNTESFPRARDMDQATLSSLPLPADSDIPPEPKITRHPREGETETLTPESELAEPGTIRIETKLGGFFYLINLAIHLGFYSDFTAPTGPNLQLNIWDFVALVGQALTGEQTTKDPIWSFLASLAGREEVSSFEFRVSSSSCAPTPSTNSRLCPNSKLETRNSKLSRETRNSKLETGSPKLETSVLPYIRARLSRAFGPAVEDPGSLLCRHHARVSLTATHVNVFFGLNELPIEIRLSGLDRDPGWVPAAGRFIAFHFD